MKHTQRILFTAGLLSSVLFLSTIKTLAAPSATNMPQLDEKEVFEIKSPFLDSADLPDGKKVFRIYTNPRAIYKDTDGKLKKHAPGWSLFNQNSKSQLKNSNDAGYQYDFDFGNNESIKVSAGGYEEIGALTKQPQNPVFKQYTAEYQTITEYSDIYPGVNVNFRDSSIRREKEYVFTQKPQFKKATQEVVIWENIGLPGGSKILNSEEKELRSGDKIKLSTLHIKTPAGNNFIIAPAIMFDSSGPPDLQGSKTFRDLFYLIKLDKQKKVLSLGLIVDPEYFNNPNLVYPVKIDPTYYACKDGYANELSCANYIDVYLRSAWENGSTIENWIEDSGNNNGNPFYGLYTGLYDPAGANRYTRHTIIKFDTATLNSLNQIAPDYTVYDAKVYLYYYGAGNGTFNGDINIAAKEIGVNWALNANLKYRNLSVDDNDIISTTTLNTNNGFRWVSWNITSTFEDWTFFPGDNRGLIFEPTGTWDGRIEASAPPWPNRLLTFYANTGNNNFNPYLEVRMERPDLTNSNSNRNPASVNPGGTVTVNFRTANQGWVPSDPSSIFYYVNPQANCQSTVSRTGIVNIPSIGSGFIDTRSINYTVPQGTAAGRYCIYVRIDPDNTCPESNENNNTYNLTFDVTNPAAPDLTYTGAPTINPSQISPGGQTTFSSNIQNIGNANAAATTIIYYLDGATQLGQYNLPALSAGQSTNVSKTLTIPAGTSAGQHAISFRITPVAGESNQNNNQYSTNITVNALPDLWAEDIVIDGNQFYYTEHMYSTNVVVHNAGPVAVNGARYLLKLRDNGGIVYDFTTVGSFDIGANTQATINMSGMLPALEPFLAPYQVLVTLDPTGLIAESREDNNTAGSPNRIQVERYYYGGGGGSPPPDEDRDGDPDIAEIAAGTNILVADARPIADVNVANYSVKQHDTDANNTGGDPVNSRTGGFDFSQTDFELPGRGFPIKFERTFNSMLAERRGRLGNGWTHSYNIFYYQDPDTKNVEVYRGGARIAFFTTTDGGAHFTPPPGDYDTLYPENDYVVYKTLDGVRYIFSKKLSTNFGMLERIIDTNGNTTQLTYMDRRNLQLLTTITDPSGRSITLTYGAEDNNLLRDKIIELRDNVNPDHPRIITYEYDGNPNETPVPNANLIRVTENRYYNGQMDSIVHNFAYDANHRITTYTDPRNTVLYNDYDAQGRVTKQHEGNPRLGAGDKRQTFEFTYSGADANAPGSTHCTVVTNYRIAGDFFSDTSCFNANELKIYTANSQNEVQRWTYDDKGMPASYTAPNGKVASYEYDSRRRQIKEILPDTSAWHTEISFTYENDFNRLISRTETATSLANPPLPQLSRTTSYTIDSANGNILRITDPLNNFENFTYDAHGNLSQYEDKNRNATSYTYDNNGNYLTRESSQGIAKNYTYDVYGNRTGYTDPRGANFTYEYDTQGNLRRQTSPVGNKTYEYDLENHRTAEIDELGHRTNYVYDTDTGAHLLRTEKVGNGITLTFAREYDWFGNLTKETDPNGNQTRYSYNGANRLATKTDPFNSIEYEYDNAGNLINENNSLGQKTAYFYNARRNPTEVRHYLDANNFISNKKEYDGFNRVIKEIDGKNNQTLYVYDLANRVTQKTNALGGATLYSYDNNGNKILETNPRGNTTTFAYDGLNRLIRITNAQNKQTINSYDANGNLISIVDRQNADGTANLHVTSFTFDSLNRKTEETNSLGNKNIFTYDAGSNLRTKTDRDSRVWTYNYDDFNRLISETDPGGNALSYIYDLNGNKTRITYPDTTRTNFEYDALNRLTKTTDQLGKMRTYTYDAVGNKLSETDKRQFTTSYTYDKLNRVISETNPENTATTYTYDGNSNRLAENVAGKTTTYTYDALNRKTQITYPGGKTESFEYDANGNLWKSFDGDASVTEYTYDSLDRPTLKALPDGTNVSYTYDNWNNVLTISENSGTSAFVYNNENRVTREDKTLAGLEGRTFTIQRTYKNDGQIASLTNAAGISVNYNYNSRGLLGSVIRGGSTLAAYTYNSLGKPATLTYGNGTKTIYNYDSLNRPQDFTITDSAEAQLFKQAYSYDEESNRTQLIENDTRTINYTYDNLEQLTGVKYEELGGATDTLTYTYDRWGNRLTLRSPFGNKGYSYAANSNELTGYSASGRLVTSATYNSNGGLAQEILTRGGKQIRTTAYSWDSQNRLSGITFSRTGQQAFLPALGNNILTFAYDYAGNRIKKTANGESTYYLNDGLTVLNEISSAGTVTKSIIKGLSQIAEISADGTITYVHQDSLDSTVLLTNQAGAVVAEYEYDVFGDVIGADEGASSSEKTSYLFTNQEFDPESDLFYYNARYYNPSLGRFISRDAVLGKDGDILSRNLFIYVKNNPLKYTDPTGNEEEEVYVSVQNQPEVRIAGIASDIYGSVKSGVSSAWDATKSAAAWTWDTTKSGTLQTLDMFPIITGDLSDAYAMHFGRTLFSGQELSQEDLDLIGAMATVPFLTGGQARAGKKLAEKVEKAAEWAKKLVGKGGKELFNFTETAAKHMNEAGRMIPIQTLNDIIKAPMSVVKDPKGSSSAFMYYSQMWRNGKLYNVEVLYDKATNVISHFKYDTRPLGPLPSIK